MLGIKWVVTILHRLETESTKIKCFHPVYRNVLWGFGEFPGWRAVTVATYCLRARLSKLLVNNRNKTWWKNGRKPLYVHLTFREVPPPKYMKVFHKWMDEWMNECIENRIKRQLSKRSAQVVLSKPDVMVADVHALKHESWILWQWSNPALYLIQERALPVLHGPNSTESNLFHHGETRYRFGFMSENPTLVL